MSLILLASALIVGLLIGAVGVGGILLIPALAAWGGLDTHQAMATALFSFIFTGILGTWLYQRHGSIDWKITIPICIGAILGAYPGAIANALVSGLVLDLILGCVIVFAGVYALLPATAGDALFRNKDSAPKYMLYLIGVCVGFGSGLTGVGGPVLSVPLMVILGFNPLVSIATSQAIQIAAAISGSAGNLANNFIDLSQGLQVAAAELAGVAAGVYLAHRTSQILLKRIIAFVCIIIGGFIMLRSFIQ